MSQKDMQATKASEPSVKETTEVKCIRYKTQLPRHKYKDTRLEVEG